MQSENDSSEFSDLLDSEGVCKLYQVSMNGQFQSNYNLSMDRAALVTPLHAMCGAIWAFWGLAVARLQFFDAAKLRKRSPLHVQILKLFRSVREGVTGQYKPRRRKTAMGLHQSSDQVEYSESRERIWHCIRAVSIHGSLAILFHGLYDYFIMLRINERNHLPVQDWEYIARSDPFVYTLNGFTLLGLFLTVRMLSIGVTAVAPWK